MWQLRCYKIIETWEVQDQFTIISKHLSYYEMNLIVYIKPQYFQHSLSHIGPSKIGKQFMGHTHTKQITDTNTKTLYINQRSNTKLPQFLKS